MIDTHCHLNLDPLDNHIDQHIKDAKQAGVTDFIIPGVNIDSSHRAVALSKQFQHCYASVGIHPEEADQVLTNNTNLDAFKTWVISSANKKQIVAIGECGLDYFRLEDNQQRPHTIKSQMKLFKFHLHLAKETNLPLIIHMRDAATDILNLITQSPPRGVLHCFSGDQSYLRQALKLGFYISFAGNITFKNAKPLRDLLLQVPNHRLLLETDAPFLNPQRGHWPNTPGNIVSIYQKVAELKHMTLPELSKLIHSNAKTLFQI